MCKTSKDTQSVSHSSLSQICVFLPITLSLIAIVSTTLSAEIQSQIIMGLPVILWLWFAIALLICLNTLVFALQVIKGKDNLTNDTGSNDHE